MKSKKYRYIAGNKTKCPFCGEINCFGIGWSGVGCNHIMIREDKEFKRNGVLRYGKKFTFIDKKGTGG